jgi:hypothetical protein
MLFLQQFESEARDRYETFLQKEEEIKEDRNSIKVQDNKEKILPQLKAENATLQQQSLESQKGISICHDI